MSKDKLAIGQPSNDELREWIQTARTTAFKAESARKYLTVRLTQALDYYNQRCAELQAEADEAPGLVERLEKQIDGWQGELARRRAEKRSHTPRRSAQASAVNKAARVEALVKRILLGGEDGVKAGEELKALI